MSGIIDLTGQHSACVEPTGLGLNRAARKVGFIALATFLLQYFTVPS